MAVTDYEGLSTPGPHPYLNGEAVADDVVDAVRASRQLGVPTTGRWVVAGFSQGGHAALFVGEHGQAVRGIRHRVLTPVEKASGS